MKVVLARGRGLVDPGDLAGFELIPQERGGMILFPDSYRRGEVMFFPAQIKGLTGAVIEIEPGDDRAVQLQKPWRSGILTTAVDVKKATVTLSGRYLQVELTHTDDSRHVWDQVGIFGFRVASKLCTFCGNFERLDKGTLCAACQHWADGKWLAYQETASGERGRVSTVITTRLTYPAEVSMDWIRDYWTSRYHPAGYGTNVTDQGVEDGFRKVVVTRYDNCD